MRVARGHRSVIDNLDHRDQVCCSNEERDMNIKLLVVGLGLVLLLCAVVLAFEALLFPSDPPAGRTAALGAASQRLARSPAPASIRRAAVEPAGQLPELGDPAPRGAPPPGPEPLTPELENARLRRVFDDSGVAAGDALDRSGHDIARDLVARLRAHDAQVSLQAIECRAAGCAATLELAAEVDYLRLHGVFDGVERGSPLARWPGSRIMPPVVHRDSKLLVTVLLIRPDARAQF
jgi:hypothetical protein